MKTILVSKDKKWIYINDVETLFSHLDQQNMNNEIMHLYNDMISKENHPSKLPNDFPEKSSYISHHLSSILNILKDIDKLTENKIKSFQKHGFIYINRQGGYNSIENFIDKNDMIISNLDRTIFVNQPQLNSKILFLENAKEIDAYWLQTIQIELDDDSVELGISRDDVQNYSSITMLKENMELGILIPAIKKLIAKYKKLIICFATTQDKLYDDQLQLFAAFKNNIESIYFHGSKIIAQQLTALNIKNKEIK